MAPTSLTDLPFEILDTIIHHCYPSWTVHVLDRIVRGTLAIDGIPPSTMLLVNKQIASLALRHERASFSGQVVFTTSSTQWRLLKRLRSISPTRLAWVVDNITALVFCSPPLFTNRIPWSEVPGLRRIELDYCYRSAKFRCQGTARELESGGLDALIVGFARDTERFDMPLVEDAWRDAAGQPDPVGEIESVDLATNRAASCSSADVSARRVEVLVIKRMNIFESDAVCHESSAVKSSTTKPESWDVTVTATHRGRLEDVRFQIVHGNHETPFGETIVWTAHGGFRETVPFEEALRRELRVKENGERDKYLCDAMQ